MNPIMTECIVCKNEMIKTHSDVCGKCFSRDARRGLPKDR